MQLQELRVEGYQSFADTGWLTFKKGFNLIVGQNNAGKSALLRAITADFTNDQHRNETNWETAKLPSVKVSYKISVEKTEFKDWIFMMSSAGVIFPVPANDHASAEQFFESLSQFTATLIKYPATTQFQPESDPSHGLFERAHYQNSPSLRFAAQNGQISSHFGYNMGENLSLCFWHGWQANMFFFVAERMAIGESSVGYHPKLGRNAANLPNILNQLQGLRPAVFDRLIDHLRDIFPSLGNLSVAPTSNNTLEVLVWPIIRRERQEHAFPLNSSGTGVSQVIALLTAVMTIEQAVIIIDEINSFLHPAAVKSLVRILQTYYPQHQYIISTHAPEVISCCDPSTIHLVQREGFESSVRVLDVASVNSFREIAENLGIAMSDVFAASTVIWVEGPTEELCFRYLLESLPGFRMPRGLVFCSVSATGDFLRKRDRRLVFDIYNRLTDAAASLTVETRFSFDSDGLSDAEKADLTQQSGGRLAFLPRTLLECYLVDDYAISEFILAKNTALNEEVNAVVVRTKLTELASSSPYRVVSWSNDLSSEHWLADVDAAKLIAQAVAELSNQTVTFKKKHDSLFLLKSILKRNPDQLKLLIDYVQSLIPTAPPP